MLGKNDFMTIKELKEENNWPYPWISGKDLPNIIKNLGEDIKGIEIGVCRAENIFYILENCNNVNLIEGIDPYSSFKDWNGFIFTEDIMNEFYKITLKNIEEYKEKVILHKKSSREAFSLLKDDFYDYIFIDGEHTYEALSEDLKNYYSKIKTGGLVSGHDYGLPGIKQAIENFLYTNKLNINLNFCRNDVWYWVKE